MLKLRSPVTGLLFDYDFSEVHMRIPPFLKEKGTIGFIAPSFGCTTSPYAERFDNAINTFRSMGYSTYEGPNCRVALGTGISNAPEKCAEELNNAMCDNISDIIISCGGGELMCTAVPYMDFERIKSAPPKWYLGYSDNTNYIFFSTTVCDTAAIYGECAASFGQETWHQSLSDTFALLTGQKTSFSNYTYFEAEKTDITVNPLTSYVLNGKTDITCASGNTVISGRLIGGCLDCLELIAGTEFDHFNEFAEKYRDEGIILFFDSCEFNTMGVVRSLWKLKHSGWFSHNIKGVLVGRPMLMDNADFGITMTDAFNMVLESLRVPVIFGMDIGHVPPQMPTVSGAYATVTYKEGRVTVDYDFLRDRE